MRFFIIIFVLSILLVPQNYFAQQTTLVDFGNSSAANTYDLPNWNNLLLADEISYTAEGPGGLAFGAGFEEFTDYMGVAGTARQFSLGERIVVTWYNNSDETVFFSSRISFEDLDHVNGGTSEGNWYTMRSFDDYRVMLTEALPHSTVRTVFNITDSGVHKTDEVYSSVNVNLAIEWGESGYKQYLICDKIELWNDADFTPPAAPEEVSATTISDSQIQLTWNVPTDDTEVVEFLIYLNGEVEGYSREHNYTAVFLEPNTEYTFTITALDMVGNESIHSATASATTQSFRGNSSLVNPEGFEYQGAFLLPEDFAWGGEAIAYRDYNGTGMVDANGESLFVTNLNQADAGYVGEVTTAEPIISENKNLEELDIALILQNPVDIRPVNINDWEYVDIWRTGLEYDVTTNRLYSSWSIHYTVGGEKNASISFCDASDLAGSTKYGAWYLGDPTQPPIAAMANDYLFSRPLTTANTNLPDRALICGRFRDGGLSGLGPTMYAFAEVGATPPAANAVLDIATLLEYGSVLGTDNYNYPNSVDGYKHSDEWRDAAWCNIAGQQAIAVVGRKALGNNWYGYQGEFMPHDWVFFDQPYPEFGATDPDGKGWRAHNYKPMIILYDPADIAAVEAGTMQSFEPQPYAAVRLDENIFWNDDCEIRSIAFDQMNSRLFVTEFDRANDGNLLIHVWQLNEMAVGTETTETIPINYKLEQNYPNPFNPTTIIKYEIPNVGDASANSAQAHSLTSSKVSVKVYNVLGQVVSVLVDEYKPAGTYEITFDGSSIRSGVYFYTLETSSFRKTKKLVLLK